MVRLDQLTLVEKTDSPAATSLPVTLGLAILRDRALRAPGRRVRRGSESLDLVEFPAGSAEVDAGRIFLVEGGERAAKEEGARAYFTLR